MSKLKLLNVTFNVPQGYEKSSNDRTILIESETDGITEIDLDARGREPTFKSADGQTISNGSANKITIDESTTAISTTEKYSNGSHEITFLVRRFIASRDLCRSLKREVEKYDDVTYDYSFDGYRANLSNGNYAFHGVFNRCLVIVTTDDSINIPTVVGSKKMNTGALIRVIVGIAVLLLAVFAFIKVGFQFRLLILIAIGIIFLSTGYNQLHQKDIECPKLKI